MTEQPPDSPITSSTPAFSESPENDLQHHPPVSKHSGLGIASFIISLVAIILIIVGISIITSTSADIPDTQDPDILAEEIQQIVEDYPEIAIAFLIGIFGFFVMFIGAILGIISLFNKQRKKLYPILGTIINGLPILFIIISLMIG